MMLGFVLLGLILITWIYSMYLSWKVSQGTVFASIKTAPFIDRFTTLIRLVRRGWYGVEMETKQVVTWGTKRAEGALVALFPKAAHAFTKPDELTGLTHGPSSYFLKSISGLKKDTTKRLPKSKKVV